MLITLDQFWRDRAENHLIHHHLELDHLSKFCGKTHLWNNSHWSFNSHPNFSAKDHRNSIMTWMFMRWLEKYPKWWFSCLPWSKVSNHQLNKSKLMKVNFKKQLNKICITILFSHRSKTYSCDESKLQKINFIPPKCPPNQKPSALASFRIFITHLPGLNTGFCHPVSPTRRV